MEMQPLNIIGHEKKIAAFFSARGRKAVFPKLENRNDPRWMVIWQTFSLFSSAQIILDVGCGRGRYLRELETSDKKVAGIELNEEFVAELKGEGKQVMIGSISSLPFDNASVDGVLCSEVLEHVIDVDMAIAEMFRVLKYGGIALILDKSIYGFHHQRFKWYPYGIEKRYKEQTDQWMYPKDFFFRERRFDPWRMKRRLAHKFSSVDMKFIPYDATPESFVCRFFPFLRQTVVWKCLK